jgi:hypothetical protein
MRARLRDGGERSDPRWHVRQRVELTHQLGELFLGLVLGGKRLHEASRADPAKGGVFRELQLVDTLGVEARAGFVPMNAAGLDLGQVCQQFGEELVRGTDQTSSARENILVRER